MATYNHFIGVHLKFCIRFSHIISTKYVTKNPHKAIRCIAKGRIHDDIKKAAKKT